MVDVDEDEDDYRFLKLKDAAICLNQRVSLIGVIFEFGIPQQSDSSEYFVSIKLIDESYPEPGITVNIFAEDVEKLPFIASPGDIALLSDVVIKPNTNDICVTNGVCALYNQKSSSFALFKGIDGEDFVPYQASSNFLSRELDKKFIENLRKWLVCFQLGADPDDLSPFHHIKLGQRHNFVAKILHTCEVTKDEWIIFIWDGNDAPINNIETKMSDEMNNPLNLQREPEVLPRDVLCTFPWVGTVLRVIMDGGSKNCPLGFLKTGRWVNFHDIVCEVDDGLWYGVLTSTTKLRYIPQDHCKIMSYQSCYKQRLSSKLGRVSRWVSPEISEVTVVDHDDAPFLSLMDVITYPKVVAKYKCLVRVVAVFPWPPEQFMDSNEVYRVRLTLEDPTARIHAYLYAEDGDKFFDRSIPADVLRRRVNKLIGVDENAELNNPDEYSVRSPPIVQCCLKSYYLDKTDPWNTRKYRIFGTRLVGSS